jgi:hypothetical protein
VSGDGGCDRRRSKTGLLTVEFLNASSLERIAAADQLAQLAQVGQRRRPGRRHVGAAEACDQRRIELVSLVARHPRVKPGG